VVGVVDEANAGTPLVPTGARYGTVLVTAEAETPKTCVPPITIQAVEDANPYPLVVADVNVYAGVVQLCGPFSGVINVPPPFTAEAGTAHTGRVTCEGNGRPCADATAGRRSARTRRRRLMA
jgi:hypothetical protein